MPEGLPWDEHQVVTGEAPTVVANVDDDLERELAFYNQARRWEPDLVPLRLECPTRWACA